MPKIAFIGAGSYGFTRTLVKDLLTYPALEGATLEPSTAATGLTVNWDQLLRELDQATAETEKIFLR